MLIMITGPTCSGKSTLEKELVNRGCKKISGFTTRKPRPGEVDGVDYRFLSEPPPQSAIAEEVIYNNHHYGILKEELDAIKTKGGVHVVVLEPKGKKQIVDYCFSHDIRYITIYIHQPLEVLSLRFLNRFLKNGVKLIDYKVTEYESIRLTNMFREYSEWVMEVGMYDLVLTGSNMTAMIDNINNKAKSHGWGGFLTND